MKGICLPVERLLRMRLWWKHAPRYSIRNESDMRLTVVKTRNIFERTTGLLGSSANDLTREHVHGIMIEPCDAIHTSGMRYPIDIAFALQDGRVIYVQRNISSEEKVQARGARFVIERPASNDPWFSKGNRISVRSEST